MDTPYYRSAGVEKHPSPLPALRRPLGRRGGRGAACIDRGVNVAHTAVMERRSGEGGAVTGAALPAIGRAFADGRLTAERLVQHCPDRTETYDQRGPRLTERSSN